MDFLKLKKKGEVTNMKDRNLVKGNSFEVFIKEKGKFIKKGYPMTRNEALDYGAEQVDKGSSASFKLVRSDKQPIPNTRVTYGYFSQNLPKFRPIRMKKAGGVQREQEFVEKESFRIDTEEEKKGISQKGIQRRKFRGFIQPKR